MSVKLTITSQISVQLQQLVKLLVELVYKISCSQSVCELGGLKTAVSRNRTSIDSDARDATHHTLYSKNLGQREFSSPLQYSSSSSLLS